MYLKKHGLVHSWGVFYVGLLEVTTSCPVCIKPASGQTWPTLVRLAYQSWLPWTGLTALPFGFLLGQVDHQLISAYKGPKILPVSMD